MVPIPPLDDCLVFLAQIIAPDDSSTSPIRGCESTRSIENRRDRRVHQPCSEYLLQLPGSFIPALECLFCSEADHAWFHGNALKGGLGSLCVELE
jgi:hypothetical protein